MGFFNEPSDEDGVVRRSLLVCPLGDPRNQRMQMYGSLEVQAIDCSCVRSDQVTVQFDQTGVVRLDLFRFAVKTDATGRNQIIITDEKNLSYHSVADVVQRKFSKAF